MNLVGNHGQQFSYDGKRRIILSGLQISPTQDDDMNVPFHSTSINDIKEVK